MHRPQTPDRTSGKLGGCPLEDWGKEGVNLSTLVGFVACAVLVGWVATRAPGKWTSVVLGGLLAIVLVIGFAAGLGGLLQGYATANMPMAEDKSTGSTEQVARNQEIANFCDGCHSAANNSPRGSQAVTLSGDAPIVFIPLEISHSSSGGNPDDIVAYPHTTGPDLKLFVSKWSETDFVTTLRVGKNPEGHALGRRMPWRDIAAFATDDDLRAYYEYVQGQTNSDK